MFKNESQSGSAYGTEAALASNTHERPKDARRLFGSANAGTAIGEIFQYVVAPAIQRNRNDTILTPQNMRNPQPIRHYRKEIVTPATVSSSSSGGGRLIDQLNSPGGTTHTTMSVVDGAGLDRIVIDYKAAGANFFPGNTTEHPGQCATCTDTTVPVRFSSKADDARRRVRSSGIVRSNYNMSYHQYMHRRNRTVDQNQYNYIRYGDPFVKPGDSLSLANVYAPQGEAGGCKVQYNVPTDTQFEYQWTTGGMSPDTTPTTVLVPAGSYTMVDLGNLLRRTMETHGHYYINTATGYTHIYLLDMAFNASTNQVELISYMTNDVLFPSSSYVVNRIGVDNIPYAAEQDTYNPYFILPASMATLLGFGSAPVVLPPSGHSTVATDYWTAHPSAASRTFTSTHTPAIGLPTGFVKVYYKPNNAQYAQQGAVDAGARLTRLKYNTITTNAGLYSTAFGTAIGSAMAYGTANSVYSYKSKLAFPAKRTPKVNATGFMDTCTNVLIRAK